MTGLIGLIHFSTTFQQSICAVRPANLPLGSPDWPRKGGPGCHLGWPWGHAGWGGQGWGLGHFSHILSLPGEETEAGEAGSLAQGLGGSHRRVCPRKAGRRQSAGGWELWKPRLRLPGGGSDRSDLQARRVRGAVTQPCSVQEWPCGPSSPRHHHPTDTWRALGASPPQRCQAAPARAVLRT